jgi:hypothetical protein
VSLKIGIDIGGVLSKYPDTFRTLMLELKKTDIEVFVISDMHDPSKMNGMLQMNNIPIDPDHVISADYAEHGEMCKAEVCKKLGIDIMIDDFIGYVARGPSVRLLVMPLPEEDYYHETWKTDGSEGNFGRRRRPKT